MAAGGTQRPLGSRLGSRYPLLSDTHAGGHLWNDLANRQGDAHLSPFHLAGYVAAGGGFRLSAAAWKHPHQGGVRVGAVVVRAMRGGLAEATQAIARLMRT